MGIDSSFKAVAQRLSHDRASNSHLYAVTNCRWNRWVYSNKRPLS